MIRHKKILDNPMEKRGYQKLKQKCGEIALAEAMEFSQDRLLNE